MLYAITYKLPPFYMHVHVINFFCTLSEAVLEGDFVLDGVEGSGEGGEGVMEGRRGGREGGRGGREGGMEGGREGGRKGRI